MSVYEHHFRVQATLDRVAEFHQDPRALKRLTPPPVIVRFHEVQPLTENSRVDFTMWIGPLPVRWVAVHSNVEFPKGFTDTQIEGPFTSWVHTHTFRMVNDRTTEIIDRVEAQPSNRPWLGLVSRFMWFSLPLLFSHRERVTCQMLELGE
jgi:ligand-binding SRPBCC domain-containing protein